MKITKAEKGITLVALIITIIVLLILVVVAIGAVQNDGIIGHAKESKQKYQESEVNEQTSLGNYLEKIDSAAPGETADEKDLVERYVLGKEKKGKTTDQIANLDPTTMTITSFKDDNESIKDASKSITPLNLIINEDTMKCTVLFKYNNKKYRILADLITLMTEKVEEVTELELYILGIEGKGRLAEQIIKSIDTTTMSVTEFADDENSIKDANKSIIPLNTSIYEELMEAHIAFKYNSKKYIMVIDLNTKMTKTVYIAKDELEGYLFDLDGKGRKLFEIIDEENMCFTQDPSDPTSTVHEIVKIAYMKEETPNTFYIRYERDVYKVDVNEEMITVPGSLSLINSLTGNLGKYVRYKEKDWIILRENSKTIELISANALGSVDLDRSSSFDEARSKYNDVCSKIIDECKKVTGINSNIRSVGSTVTTEDTLSKENTIDFSEIFPQSYMEEKFAQYEGTINGIRKGDTNYLYDYEQMINIGIVITDDVKEYWLATRNNITTYNKEIIFEVFKSNRMGCW